MRARLVRGSVTTAAVALVLFAVPLAVVFHLLFDQQAEDALERRALRVAGLLDPTDVTGSAQLAIARETARDADSTIVALAVYRVDGAKVAGNGPDRADASAVAAVSAGDVRRVDATQVVVAVPVELAGRPVAVVRAAEPESVVNERTTRTWIALLALALLTIGIAVLVARRMAAAVSEPMERLTVSTRALADGDFDVRLPDSGIAEIDRAAAALASTAQRLGALLEREHHLADDASHQIRTPLTGLRLALEAAQSGPDELLRARLETASQAAARLSATVDDLLSLRRPPGSVVPGRDPLDGEDLAALAREAARDNATPDRAVDVVVRAPRARTGASPGGVRQALDVLVSNAVRHGRGRVTVTVRSVAGAVAVDVADEGDGLDGLDGREAEVFTRGVSGDGGPGIGLALATSVLRAEGGRLDLASTAPTVFTMLLPGVAADTGPVHAGGPGAVRDDAGP